MKKILRKILNIILTILSIPAYIIMIPTILYIILFEYLKIKDKKVVTEFIQKIRENNIKEK